MKSLRAACASVVMLAVMAGLVQAQAGGFAGTWEFAAPNGAKISLVLQQEGRRLSGTLSGNGSNFVVNAEVGADGGFYGTAQAQAGSLFIGGERSGSELGIALAEMTSAGVPDMRTAQELRMRLVSSSTTAAAPQASSGKGTGVAPAPNTGAAPRAPGASAPARAPAAAGGLAVTAADQQLATLLTSSPWCYMRYSQAMGATSTERVVFSRDGRVVSRSQRESAVNNREGTYYGNSTDGEQGFWRVRNGNLELSADGQTFQPAPLSVTANSNGAPIIATGGKEYNRCN